MRKYKKPLNRSISIGCISLILSLCLGLSIVNCRTLHKVFFERYNTCLTVMTVQNFMDAMNKPGEISFDKDNEETIWGIDYTGMLPLTTSDEKTYTVIFTHSPIFRIGGDEVVVLMENTDYNFRDELLDVLNTSVEGYIIRTACAPWEKFSMAAQEWPFTPRILIKMLSLYLRGLMN